MPPSAVCSKVYSGKTVSKISLYDILFTQLPVSSRCSLPKIDSLYFISDPFPLQAAVALEPTQNMPVSSSPPPGPLLHRSGRWGKAGEMQALCSDAALQEPRLTYSSSPKSGPTAES